MSRNGKSLIGILDILVTSREGRVSKNVRKRVVSSPDGRHVPRGRVSRNSRSEQPAHNRFVTSREGRVSRNEKAEVIEAAALVTSRKGRVSRNYIGDGAWKVTLNSHVPLYQRPYGKRMVCPEFHIQRQLLLLVQKS